MNRNQSGFTLSEVLVALAIGLIVVSGVIGVYVGLVGSNADTLARSKLNAQLSAAIAVMSNDIRRAGYWGNIQPEEFEDPTLNPFSQTDVTLLEVHSSNVQTAANDIDGGECIVYSYDSDDNGIVDDSDIVGFRLANNAIQMRLNGDTTANARHDACNNGSDNWQNLTDPNIITITQLNFSPGNSFCLNTREPDGLDNDGADGIDDADEADCYLQPPAAASGEITVETRDIAITVAGFLTGDQLTTMTLTQNVRVRNDLVRAW